MAAAGGPRCFTRSAVPALCFLWLRKLPARARGQRDRFVHDRRAASPSSSKISGKFCDTLGPIPAGAVSRRRRAPAHAYSTSDAREGGVCNRDTVP